MAAAQRAAAGGLAPRVVLVDPAADVVRGLALDLCQAGAVTGTSTLVAGTDDLSVVVGASAIVLADRAGSAGEWTGEDGLALLTRVRTLNRRALVVCAGPSQDVVIERAVVERGGDATLVAGSAPDALRAAMTGLAALEAAAAPRDVSLMVVGRAPSSLFVAWEGASIGGSRAADVLTPPVMARLDGAAPFLWPPGPLALGAAAARVAGLALGRAPGRAALSVLSVDGTGPAVAAVVPATVQAGQVRPLWPLLSPRDRVRFDTAVRAGG